MLAYTKKHQKKGILAHWKTNAANPPLLPVVSLCHCIHWASLTVLVSFCESSASKAQIH